MRKETKTGARTMTAYNIVKTPTAQQEWYETASGDARRRARELRKAGFGITVSSPSEQITTVGIMKMTLVTISLSFVGVDIPPVAEGHI